MFGMAVLDLPLTIVWVVVVTNALNLLDNMDGLLRRRRHVRARVLRDLRVRELSRRALAVALAARARFLLDNFLPARVFLGDAGSLLVGFLLAAIGLNLDLIGKRA